MTTAARDSLLLLLWIGPVCAVGFTCAGGRLFEWPAVGLGLLAVGGAAWLAAFLFARVRGCRIAVAVGGAVLLHALAFAGDPGTSDDVARYVWEGGLVLRGKSPYAHAPAAPERAAERMAWGAVYAGLNHPEVSAAYPPLSQAAFAAAVALGGGPARSGGEPARRAVRGLFALCSLFALLPLARLAHRSGKPVGPVLLGCGWCPLVPLELAGAGHLDALAILLLLAGLAAAEEGRRSAGAVLLALGGLAKLLPLVALPTAVRGRGAARRLALAATLVLGGVAAVLLLEDGTRGVGSGLWTYGAQWEGGSLVFRFLDTGLRAVLPGSVHAGLVGRGVAAAIFAVVFVASWRQGLGPARAAGRLVCAWLLLSPTLHPWYAVWVVPFVALRPRPAWCFLAAAAPLLHGAAVRYRTSGVWEEPSWVLPVVVLPLLALLALEGALRWRRR